MTTGITLSIHKTKKEVASEASTMIAKTINAHRNPVLGLATGSTPAGTYEQLTHLYKQNQLSFHNVTTFNLDEYAGLDGSHEQSYRYFMQHHLFDYVDIQPWNTNVLNGVAVDQELECLSFEQKIRANGGVDLWLLGIGQNGHIAFNEPGSAVSSRTRLVTLSSSTIAANSDGRFFSNLNDVPRCALTAGIATIRDARKLVLLATGEAKADAVAAAVEGEFTENCPASLLQDHHDVTFILDEAAASKLHGV